MRTTVTLQDDVAAAVRRLTRERGIGVSEAVNTLARAGLVEKTDRSTFRQRTVRLGLKIDVTNVGEAIEVVDGAGKR
jgi:hypothetical protein